MCPTNVSQLPLRPDAPPMRFRSPPKDVDSGAVPREFPEQEGPPAGRGHLALFPSQQFPTSGNKWKVVD